MIRVFISQAEAEPRRAETYLGLTQFQKYRSISGLSPTKGSKFLARAPALGPPQPSQSQARALLICSTGSCWAGLHAFYHLIKPLPKYSVGPNYKIRLCPNTKTQGLNPAHHMSILSSKHDPSIFFHFYFFNQSVDMIVLDLSN